MKKRHALTLSALLAALAVSTIAAPVMAQTPTPASATNEIAALRDAKTIRVTETCSLVLNSTHLLSPCARMEIAFSRPESYRIGMTYLQPGMAAPKPSLLVSNGETVGEYVSLNNQFLVRAVKDSPDFRLSEALSIDALAELNLLTHSFQSLLVPAEGGAGTTSQTMLDNHPATLTNMAKGQRLWRDSQTGLPLRYERYSINKGEEMVIQRIDYSDWVIDKPIPPADFVWKTPAGAIAYHPTDLLPVGTSAPDFSAVTPEGKTVRLSDFKNKIVVLDFWATWCHPCQEAMPHLEELYKQTKGKDVVVLALCVMDQREAYDKWVIAKKKVYSFPTAFDTAGSGEASIAISKYGVKGIPTQYIIDKNGKVAFAGTGYQQGDKHLETALAKMGIEVR